MPPAPLPQLPELPAATGLDVTSTLALLLKNGTWRTYSTATVPHSDHAVLAELDFALDPLLLRVASILAAREFYAHKISNGQAPK